MRFKAKPITVSAWRFDGSLYNAVDVMREAGQSDKDFTLTSKGITFGKIDVYPGDWLVKHDTGTFAVYDEDEFREAFFPTEE